MKSFGDKIFSKIIVVIIIILFAVGFRELILTDEIGSVFGELMGTLPFSKQIVDVICTVMKYQDEIPLITSSSIIADLIKLSFMTLFQPIFIGILTSIFLKLPSNDYTYNEKYMNSTKYRIKEISIRVLTTPVLAFIASKISDFVLNYLDQKIGYSFSIAAGIILILILGIFSTLYLAYRWKMWGASSFSWGRVFSWRLLITFAWKMFTTFLTNSICLWLYIEIISKSNSGITVSVFSLIAFIIIVDILSTCLQRIIVGDPQTWKKTN